MGYRIYHKELTDVTHSLIGEDREKVKGKGEKREVALRGFPMRVLTVTFFVLKDKLRKYEASYKKADLVRVLLLKSRRPVEQTS
jgi:hypothetical protein